MQQARPSPTPLCTAVVHETLEKLTASLTRSTAELLRKAPKRQMKNTKAKKGGSSDDILEFKVFSSFPIDYDVFTDAMDVTENLSGNAVGDIVAQILQWSPMESTDYNGMRAVEFEQKFVNSLFAPTITTNAVEEESKPKPFTFFQYLLGVMAAMKSAEGISWEILECIMDIVVSNLVERALKNYTGTEIVPEQLTNLQNMAMQYFKPRSSLRLQDALWDHYRGIVNTTWSRIFGILSKYHFSDVFQKFMARVAFVLDPIPSDEAAAYFLGIRNLSLPRGTSAADMKNVNDYLSQHVALAETYKFAEVRAAQSQCLLHAVPQLDMTGANQPGTPMAHNATKLETMYAKLLEWSLKHEDLRHIIYPTAAVILSRGTDRFYNNYVDIFFKKFLFKNIAKEKDKEGHLASILFYLRGLHYDSRQKASINLEEIAVYNWREIAAPDYHMWGNEDPIKAIRVGVDPKCYSFTTHNADKDRPETFEERIRFITVNIFPGDKVKNKATSWFGNLTAMTDIIVQIGANNMDLVINSVLTYLFSNRHNMLEYLYAAITACRIMLTKSSGFLEHALGGDESKLAALREKTPLWATDLLKMCEGAVGIGMQGVSPKYCSVKSLAHRSVKPDIPDEPLSAPEAQWSMMVAIYRESVRTISMFKVEAVVSHTPTARALIHRDLDLAAAASQVLLKTAFEDPSMIQPILAGLLAVNDNPNVYFATAQLTLLEHLTAVLKIASDNQHRIEFAAAEAEARDAFWHVVYEIEAVALVTLSSTSVPHREKALLLLESISMFCQTCLSKENRAHCQPRVFDVILDKAPEIIVNAVRVTQAIYTPVSHRDPEMEPAPVAISLRDIAVIEDDIVMKRLWPQCLAQLSQECVEHGCLSVIATGRKIMGAIFGTLPPVESASAVGADVHEIAQVWACCYSLYVGMCSCPTPAKSMLPFDTVQSERENVLPEMLKKLVATMDNMWPNFICNNVAYSNLGMVCLSSLSIDSIGAVTSSFIQWFFATLKKTKKATTANAFIFDAIRVMCALTQNLAFSKSLVNQATISLLLSFWQRIDAVEFDEMGVGSFENLKRSISYIVLVQGMVRAVRFYCEEHPEEKNVWNLNDRNHTVQRLFYFTSAGRFASSKIMEDEIAVRGSLQDDPEGYAAYESLLGDLQIAVRNAVADVLSIGAYIHETESIPRTDLEWFLDAEKNDHRVLRWVLKYRSDLTPQFVRSAFATWKPDSQKFFFDAICDQILPSYSTKFPRSSGMGKTMEYILQSATLDDSANNEPDEAAQTLMDTFSGELLVLGLFNMSALSIATRLRSFWLLLWLANHLGMENASDLQEAILEYEELVTKPDIVSQEQALSGILKTLANLSNVAELVLSTSLSVFDTLPLSTHHMIFRIMHPFLKGINLSTVSVPVPVPAQGEEEEEVAEHGVNHPRHLISMSNKEFLEQLFAATVLSSCPETMYGSWLSLADAVELKESADENDLPLNARVILEFLVKLSAERTELELENAKMVAGSLFHKYPNQVVAWLGKEFTDTPHHTTGYSVAPAAAVENADSMSMPRTKPNVARMFPALLQVERRIHRDSMAAAPGMRPSFKQLVKTGMSESPAVAAAPGNVDVGSASALSRGDSTALVAGQGVSADAFKLPSGFDLPPPPVLSDHDVNEPSAAALPPQPQLRDDGKAKKTLGSEIEVTVPFIVHDFGEDLRPIVERQHAALSLLTNMVASEKLTNYPAIAALIHFAIVNFNVESGRRSSNIRLLLLNLMLKAKPQIPESLMMTLERLIAWLRSPAFLLYWGKDGAFVEAGDLFPFGSASAVAFVQQIFEIMKLSDADFKKKILKVNTIMNQANIEDEDIVIHNHIILKALMVNPQDVDSETVDALCSSLVDVVELLEGAKVKRGTEIGGEMEAEGAADKAHTLRLKSLISTLQAVVTVLGKDVIKYPRLFWSCIALLRMGMFKNNWSLYDDICDLILALLKPDGVADAVAQSPSAANFAKIGSTWTPQYTGLQPMLMQVLTSNLTPAKSIAKTMEMVGICQWYSSPIKNLNNSGDDSWDIGFLGSILPWIHAEIKNGNANLWQFFGDIAKAIRANGTVDPSALERTWGRNEADKFIALMCEGMIPSIIEHPHRAAQFAAVWNKQWNIGNESHQRALMLAAKTFVSAPALGPKSKSFIDPNFMPVISTAVGQIHVPHLKDVAFDIVRCADQRGLRIDSGSLNLTNDAFADVLSLATAFGDALPALKSISHTFKFK